MLYHTFWPLNFPHSVQHHCRNTDSKLKALLAVPLIEGRCGGMKKKSLEDGSVVAATTVLWVRSQRGTDAQPWLTRLIPLLTISAPRWDSSDLITYLMRNSASPCELLHFLNFSYVVEAQHFTGLVLPWKLISLCLNRAFNIQIILYDEVVLDNKPSYSIELWSHKKIIVSHF